MRGWWAPWLPSRRLRPFGARFGLPGYVVEAPRRGAWRARWAWLGKRGLAGGAALLLLLLLLLLPWGLGLLAAAGGGAGAWQARKRSKAKASRNSARSPCPCNSSWQRRAPSRDGSRTFDWDSSQGLFEQSSSSLTSACSLSSFQNSFQQSRMSSSAFGRDGSQGLFGHSSSFSLDPRATFSPDLVAEAVTPPSRIGWRRRRSLLADFNAVMAERGRGARTSSANSRLRLLGRPPSFPLGPRATFSVNLRGEAATPPSWINRVLKDFSPAMAERRREAWSSRQLFHHSPSSSSSSFLDQWPSSRPALTPAAGAAPDPCARETVVKALREKEKAKKRRAEEVDLEQDPINGKDKRRRHENGGSVPSALEPLLSGGAPASLVAEPATPDVLPGLKEASSSSSSSSKRHRRSSSLSSSSTESISYGIPSIYKAKGRKATPESTPGQESWSKEPWCWQCSHLEENGPRGPSKPLNVDKAVQVEMDDAETPRQEASCLQASVLRPKGPKRRRICLVRINPDEPLHLPPELQALSEAMKARTEAEKVSKLQQKVHGVSEEQTGAPSVSSSEVATSLASCLASATASSSSSSLPLTTNAATMMEPNPLADRQAGELRSMGTERSGEDVEARVAIPATSVKEAPLPLPLLCRPQGPGPMPVVFGSGAPLSRGELLPPVTEMEVTEAAPAGPSSSSSVAAAAPQLPSPSAAQTDSGGGFLAKTPTKRSSSSSVLHPTTLTTSSKRQVLAADEMAATSSTAAPVFRPVFGLPGAGSTPLVTLSSVTPATFQPIFGGTHANTTVASAASPSMLFQPASASGNNNNTAAAAAVNVISTLATTGVFTAAPASALSLQAPPLSNVATPPLPSRVQAGSAVSQQNTYSGSSTTVVASSAAAIGCNLFGSLGPPPPYTAGQPTPSSGAPQAAASPALGPLRLGSPFGYAAFGPGNSSISSSGASQATYSLPGPSASFRFGAAATTAGGGGALGSQAEPASASGATAVPLLPPLMNPVGSATQAAASSSGGLTFSIPGASQTQMAFGGGAPSGSGPSAAPSSGAPAPANSLPSFAGAGPSPLTFSIGAGARSGARQRLQARRQHARRK